MVDLQHSKCLPSSYYLKKLLQLVITVFILMLDMPKAFDTVNRKKLFKSLEQVLLPEELHLLYILTNNEFIKVCVEDEFSAAFMTFIGIMQGDWLSAILLIFHLVTDSSPNSLLH